jgi:protein TonB
MAFPGGSRRTRLDLNRVVGISGTLVLNILLLMLLLVPLSQPKPIPLAEPVPTIEWIEAKTVKPDPPPPIHVDIVRPQPRATIEVRPHESPPVVEPVIVDHGTRPSTVDVATPDSHAATSSIEPASPPAGVSLQYRRAPAPSYPREMLLAGIEGTVLLEVLVGTDGRPLEVNIHQGSGHREFDDAARRHVLRHWRFQPAMRDGRAVQAIGIVPIEFTLNR